MGASFREKLLSPIGLAAILLAVLVVAGALLLSRGRPIEQALDSHPPFSTPDFALRFSRKTPYDPHTFVGRGGRAGFWSWSREDGLALTAEGRKYFRQEGDDFISEAAAGQRGVVRVRNLQSDDERAVMDFFYEWEEISPVTALLFRPPQSGEEYLGRASLAKSADGWQVTFLETRDFDESLAQLQANASGVRR